MSADRIACYVIAGVLLLGLIMALIKSDNWSLRWICLGTIAILGLFFGLDVANILHALKFVTLFLGVFIGAFSIYDIYDDTISRTVEGSDAHACTDICPILPPKGWGVLWAFLAICLMGAGLYFALVVLDVENASWLAV